MGFTTTGAVGTAAAIAGLASPCLVSPAGVTGGLATTGPAGGLAAIAGDGGGCTIAGACRGSGTILRGAGLAASTEAA